MTAKLSVGYPDGTIETIFSPQVGLRLSFEFESMLKGESCFIITAWNPRSEVSSPGENERGNTLMRHLLDSRNLTYITALGEDDQSEYLEEGFGVFGAGIMEIASLARTFCQNAFYEVNLRGLYCLSADLSMFSLVGSRGSKLTRSFDRC